MSRLFQKDIKLLEESRSLPSGYRCSKSYYMSYEDLLDTFQLPDLSTRSSDSHYCLRMYSFPLLKVDGVVIFVTYCD